MIYDIQIYSECSQKELNYKQFRQDFNHFCGSNGLKLCFEYIFPELQRCLQIFTCASEKLNIEKIPPFQIVQSVFCVTFCGKKYKFSVEYLQNISATINCKSNI